jgi:uncharacterized protein YndB with AHSA1/START domain
MSVAPDDSGPDLRVERVIDAAPERVFDAFIEMYGPTRPDWIVASTLDLRPGGRWTVTFEPPGVPRFREERTITELDRPHRLAYTGEVIPADATARFTTAVELSLDAHRDGTRVVLSQRGLPSRRHRDDFENGWAGVLELLERRIED